MNNYALQLMLKEKRTLSESLELLEYWINLSGQELKYALSIKWALNL